LYKRTLRRRDLAYEDLIFPKVPQRLPIVLSQEEVVRLIDAAPNRLYRMILVLLYATGVRRTEAARIKVESSSMYGLINLKLSVKSVSVRARGTRLAPGTKVVRNQEILHFRYALTKSIMSSASSCGGVKFRSGDSKWCRM
jgi:site-specific recombinase XerD